VENLVKPIKRRTMEIRDKTKIQWGRPLTNSTQDKTTKYLLNLEINEKQKGYIF
jgi:hypothetical protein